NGLLLPKRGEYSGEGTFWGHPSSASVSQLQFPSFRLPSSVIRLPPNPKLTNQDSPTTDNRQPTTDRFPSINTNPHGTFLPQNNTEFQCLHSQTHQIRDRNLRLSIPHYKHSAD